ncbi:MAG: AsmA-like C-terminal region-containing protein [Bacteroidetes bacterium]|jgi:hypothetical protein|nr:AsmA-like C-terminal region-containing protein [Bacteroidota bacterium]
MKSYIKVIRIIAAIVFVLFIALFTSSLIIQDKVADIILRSLNRNLSTKYDFATVKLSFFKKFPKASLDLRDVVVYSSPGFDTSCFIDVDTDTLLSAESVIMEFKITDIIAGEYNIERIGIKNGFLNLLTDTSGLVNYVITTGNKGKNGNIFTIDLNRINLTDVAAQYNNLAINLLIRGFAESGHLKSRISGDHIDFTAKGKLKVEHFRLNNFSMTRSVDTDLDVNLHHSDTGTSFTNSRIYIDDYDFGLNGHVSSENVLDLILRGNNIDLSAVKNYFPEKYTKTLSEYNPTGILNIESRFTGLLSRTSPPEINIIFRLDNGSITYDKSELSIDNLSFSGHYTNGSQMIPETSSLSLTGFEGRLGSATYKGSFLLSDFNALNSRLMMTGRLFPAEIISFFNLKNIISAKGTIDFDIDMKGNLQRRKKYSFPDFFNFRPEAELNFRSFGIVTENNKFTLENVNGDLFVSDTTIARNLRFTYRDQPFEISGKMIRFTDWISGKPAVMNVTADVSSENISPENLFSDTSSESSSGGKLKPAILLPRNMLMDINFRIDNLSYKSFSASDISATVNYSPGMISFKSLNLCSLNGLITGDGFFAQNNDKSFLLKGVFDLEKIDINNTFSTFNNFGQKFIVSENLQGLLSGTLSLLIPMDSLLKPDIKSLVAEGNYIISDGALIDFDPVKELSSFIELSELQNIHFEELENDFFIRNNSLFIPQMEVNSSAADLSINGRHDFENNYEYHVKILLSEILSRKIRKPRPNTTEFGAVQDDGLGHTSLFLKIANKGKEVKVSYDIKAAGNQIREDIKTERQTLRNILNEEYGRTTYDSPDTSRSTGKTRRFRVIWEERDGNKAE